MQRIKLKLSKFWNSKGWDIWLMALIMLFSGTVVILEWKWSMLISSLILLGLWLFACGFWSIILWDYYHSDL